MSDAQYLDIPLDQLHDSPTQPRLVYDDAYLAELGADIKSHGRNLSPLLVRPRVPELFAAVGDADLARKATAGYEIVFGHCRKRGCEIAGLTTARCEVRAMTDQEVERAQISENLQRKNVHPFEEAQGFQALIDRHADTADAIAERTGKSRSYVYGRLKLLQACAEVRKACLAGEIGAEVALLVARLRSDKLQAKALARIKAKYWKLDDGGKSSYRNIRELLNEEFTLDLKSAPFPIDAADLAGAGACPTCPKRSANAPEYQDVAEDRKTHSYSRQHLGPNVCTDPECFAAKKVAHFKNQAEELRKKGREVIDGNKARVIVSAVGDVKGGYIKASEVREALREREKLIKQGRAIVSPKVVVIQNPRDGKLVEVVKESDLVALDMIEEKPAKTASSASRSNDDWREQQRKDEAEAERLTSLHMGWLEQVRTAARAAARSTFDLRLTLRMLINWLDDNDGGETLEKITGTDLDKLLGKLDDMTADELGLLLLDCALVEGVEVDRWDLDTKPTALLAAAKHYGVGLRDELAPTPSTAARAQGEVEAGGEAWPWPGDAAQSKATLAPAEATTKKPTAAALQPVQAWPFTGKPPAKTKNQAGSAGKEVKGAGSAGGVAATRGQVDEVPA